MLFGFTKEHCEGNTVNVNEIDFFLYLKENIWKLAGYTCYAVFVCLFKSQTFCAFQSYVCSPGQKEFGPLLVCHASSSVLSPSHHSPYFLDSV